MNTKKTNSYKPIPLSDFKIKTEEEMELISQKHLLEMRSRHTIRDFSNSKGKTGSFQEHFKIYGMLGKNCSNSDCNYKIQKIVISNRASFFCPKCQK